MLDRRSGHAIKSGPNHPLQLTGAACGCSGRPASAAAPAAELWRSAWLASSWDVGLGPGRCAVVDCGRSPPPRRPPGARVHPEASVQERREAFVRWYGEAMRSRPLWWGQVPRLPPAHPIAPEGNRPASGTRSSRGRDAKPNSALPQTGRASRRPSQPGSLGAPAC